VQKAIYYCYKNFRVVKPHWSKFRVSYYCILSFYAFAKQRFDSILFLTSGKVRHKTGVINKEIVEEIYKKKGAIFISIHAGSYPVLGKIYNDHFSDRKLIVPFYNHNRLSIFDFFRNRFKKYGIEVVSLGGSMKDIRPVLLRGGSVVLFLDAELPVRHTEKVTMFNKRIELSTGALWLARKYDLAIIPVVINKKNGRLNAHFYEQIEYKNKGDAPVMQEIANKLEKMVLKNLKTWHVYDQFLLR